MSRLIDRTGHVFGRLTVLERAESRRTGSRTKTRWLCQCSCGRVVIVDSGNLQQQITKSCGCLNNERRSQCHLKHGLYNTDEYIVWSSMLARCRNPNNAEYELYGGRGITVCDSWLDFSNFIEDMGKRPSKNHSLDRYPDKDGPYSPENCRWATAKEQARNTRRNRLLVYNGRAMPISQWEDELGFPSHTISNRMRLGWPIERIFTTPVGIPSNTTPVTYAGRTMSMADWDREMKFPKDLLSNRLRLGWSVEKALTTPLLRRRKQGGEYQ